jgi:hypothetical protein
MRILACVGLSLVAAFLPGFLFGLYQVVGSGLFWESPASALVYALVVGAYSLCVLGIPAAVLGGVVGAALHRRALNAPPKDASAEKGATTKRDQRAP